MLSLRTRMHSLTLLGFQFQSLRGEEISEILKNHAANISFERNKICRIKINQELWWRKKANSRIFFYHELRIDNARSICCLQIYYLKTAILIEFCENSEIAICLLICSGIYYVNNNFTKKNLIT